MPKTRKIPTRMCVSCRRMRPKRDMIRVVRTPDGAVQVDPTGKLSGRGAYVCPQPDCVEVGVREQRLQHALEIPIPEEIVETLRAVAVRTRERDMVKDQGPREHPRVIRPLSIDR